MIKPYLAAEIFHVEKMKAVIQSQLSPTVVDNNCHHGELSGLKPFVDHQISQRQNPFPLETHHLSTESPATYMASCVCL